MRERRIRAALVLSTVILLPLLWLCRRWGLIPTPVTAWMTAHAAWIMGLALLSTLGPAALLLRQWQTQSRGG